MTSDKLERAESFTTVTSNFVVQMAALYKTHSILPAIYPFLAIVCGQVAGWDC
jgi:hypothetical protein